MEDKLEKAIQIATQYHKGQMRKNGLPYISHPIAVMNILKEYDFPEDALIAAVLHDTGEDTDFNNINLNKVFGSRVGFIVNALSKNKKPKSIKKLEKEYKSEHDKPKNCIHGYSNLNEYIDYRFHLYINRLYVGILAEPWIFFIKIADQIHNLGDMESFSKEKAQKKIDEMDNYFLPIYIKLESQFQLHEDSYKNYTLFLQLITNSINEAKKNIK